MADEVQRLIDDQIAYYDARAGEYDKTSTPPGDPLASDGELVEAAFEEFAPRGRVLELACGTGHWTRRALRFANTLTAVDASSEMLARHRAQVDDARVTRICADVFSWEPDGTYDIVFFTFWLSHVPLERFDAFWTIVRGCLGRGGRVFFADEGDHDIWNEDFIDRDVVRRRLIDGSEHRAVKVFWRPSNLQARLRDMKWDVSVASRGPFYWGVAQPSGDSIG